MINLTVCTLFKNIAGCLALESAIIKKRCHEVFSYYIVIVSVGELLLLIMELWLILSELEIKKVENIAKYVDNNYMWQS